MQQIIGILSNHIRVLHQFSLLPSNWRWTPEILKELKTVDEQLIRDILELHRLHQDNGMYISKAIPLLKQLADALKKIDPKQLDKRHKGLLHALISEADKILEKQFGYYSEQYGHLKFFSHMTPSEIAQYKQYFQNRQYREALTLIKHLWNERVDRKFIQKMVTIHWAYPENLGRVIESIDRRHELSCAGYISPPYAEQYIAGTGIWVSGTVTLASNSDLRSDQWVNIPGFIRGEKFTEHVDDLILNAQTFTSPHGFTPGKSHNEFLVANWKPIAFVIDLIRDKSKLAKMKRLSLKYKMSLLDHDGNKIKI